MRRTIWPVLFQRLAVLVAVLALSCASPAFAAPAATTRYVSPTGSDANNCLSPATACRTIGRAVTLSADGDRIEIAAGVYNEHDIQLSAQLTLNGAGAASTVVDAGSAGRGFYVTAAVEIAGLTVRNGRRPAGALYDAGGGAVLVNAAGNLTLRDVTLAYNTAGGSGGAIFNAGKLTLESSQVISNTAQELGGGIYNHGLAATELTVTESTVAHNTAAGYDGGGGIYNSGKLTVRSSTVADNSGATFGGGLSTAATAPVLLEGVTLSGNRANTAAALWTSNGAITAVNLTVSGNNASNNYGGIYASGPGVNLTLKNSTLARNTRTNTVGKGVNGVMRGDSAAVSLMNTLLADNDGDNCTSSQPPTSQGNNLSDDYSCGLTQSSDKPGVNPLLGPLAANGGPVATHALLSGSPAIDAGANAQCPATDARGVARPYDGDADGTAVCDIGAFEARHRVSIADVSVSEGNSGATTAAFTVALSPASATAISVNYTTVNETATAGSDYMAVSGALTFNPGETQKVVNVSVLGDTADEPDETFLVRLTTAANVDVADAEAVATILDDDGLSALSVADATALEGNSGATAMQFTVSLSPASSAAVTVQYATANGTATAGSDYTAASGALIFSPGQTSQTVTVQALGDTVDEGAAETFTLQLSSPSGATLVDGAATGTITDDDEARLAMQSINPSAAEGNSGVTPLVFTVSLSPSAAFAVTVDYAAASGSGPTGAIAGEDFTPASGTLTFAPAEISKTFTVSVIGDIYREPDEIFWVSISNGSVPIGGSVTSGTILNDDQHRLHLPLVRRNAGN